MNNTAERIDVVRRNLKLACALRDITASEVARRAGLSRNALSQFISGRTSMSHGNLLDVCDVLQIPIGILHKPDAISENRIRLYTILDRMPDHLATEALQAAIEFARSRNQPNRAKDDEDK